MTTLVEKLTAAAEKTGSIACFGMDPVVDKLPFSTDFTPDQIYTFYNAMFAEMERQGVLPGAFKPNEGYFANHDNFLGNHNFDGSDVLKDLIEEAKHLGIPVILDEKRGDILASSEQYALENDKVWRADAVTVHGYMGTDSVKPFITGDRAAYVLCRTSNPSAAEIQGLLALDPKILSEQKAQLEHLMRQHSTPENKQALTTAIEQLFGTHEPVYLHTARKILDWNEMSPGNVGAVVGATSIKELGEIVGCFKRAGKDIPLLIPGVGKQGGSAQEVMAALRQIGYNLDVVRINSSGDLNYAWQKHGPRDEYAKASVLALKKLNEEIGYKAA